MRFGGARRSTARNQIALAKTGPGARRFALIQRPRPSPDRGQVRIEVAATGICGSDLHLWHGSLPWIEKGFPMWLGHEYAGTVSDVGADVDPSLLGARVTAEPSVSCGRCEVCRGGRSNLCPERRFEAGGFSPTVVVGAERVHILPNALPLRAGTLVEPLACAVHGVLHVMELAPGDRCVVIGPGTLGILAAFVAQSQGADVLLVGRRSSRARLKRAEQAGIGATHELARGEDPAGMLERLQRPAADIVIGCAGGTGTVPTGLALLRRGGRYLELALGSHPQLLDVDALVVGEARIQGAVGHRPAAWREAISRIENGTLPSDGLAKLVTGRYPLQSWRSAFEAASDRRHVKVVIEPDRVAA